MITYLRSVFTAWCLGLLVSLLVAGSAQAQSNVLNITLGEQRVRFAPTRSFQEMRLEVVNSVGEIVFTHLTSEAEFDWNLRAGSGDALTPGLYRYALTLKLNDDQARQHTGHFIVEKGQDQLWLTASEGTEVSGTVLSASRTGGRSITGLGSKDDKSVKRDVSGRVLADEQGDKVAESNNSSGNFSGKAVKQEKAALLGTVNMVAKYDVGGVNLINSAITESGGNVGIGTIAPSSILEMVRPSVTDVVFKMQNATRAWSVGVSGSGDFWRIRDNTAGAARLTISGGTGNVGIGTTTPTSKLAVSSTDATPAVTVSATNGEALHGESSPTFGVFGSSVAGNGVAGTGTTGVYGQGSVNGVLGETTVIGGFGVHGKNTAGGKAGFFEGNVDIVGNLTKSSGTFRIDHPLDPANKYLSHSFVESPDMMNLYNGVTQLDRRGRAVVTMPDYFAALNQDFRYQLTCLGGFAPVYIAREMEGNQFVIAGGKPGMKVSWQVTGVRHDAYANDHRIKVETDKPINERGTYLYPQGAVPSVKSAIASPLAETRTPPMVQRTTAKGRR